MSRLVPLAAVLFALVPPAGAAEVAPPGTGDAPPNIVLILADDLGWSELGCYGNGFHETPHLDRLAADGVRFTQAYAAAPVCSPDRAALLTGLAPARLGILDYLRPNSANALPTDVRTLPETLQERGYRTGMIGKWHLTGYEHHGAEREIRPRDHGFDWDVAREVKGVGNGANFWPYVFRDQPIRWVDLPENRLGEEEYLVDRMNLEAVDFIERNRDRPFFLYLSHYAPHTILNGKPELVQKYRDKHPPGESTRNACYLCKDRGLEGDPLDHWAGDHNPHLAAMLESVDDGVGMIQAKLKELGLAENTIVIFTSDNGGETNVTSNAPLRGGKSELYEGGIRVPLIVSGPDRLPAGAICERPMIHTDLSPTLLDAIDPAPVADVTDGASMWEAWIDPASESADRSLHWHYPLDGPHFLGGRSAGAIRRGNWKLIEFYDAGTVELYDLAADPGERRDLAASRPEKTAELRSELADWRASVGARTPSAPLLVEPKSQTFADHFSTGQVSARWHFNGDWEATDGVLKRVRTGTENTRIFAKDLEYGDSLVRFAFRLGESKDLRFLTGSDGPYNAVVHIRPDHFRIQTAKDARGPYSSYWHGDCAHEFDPDRWYVMTVEFLGDRLVAHIDRDHVASAEHPILDQTRDYFAFQVDDGAAEIDDVQLSTVGKHPRVAENWREIQSAADRHPVPRSLEERLEIAVTNARDRLYRTDDRYRALVDRVEELDREREAAFPIVYRSQKAIRHDLSDLRRRLHEEDPRYKELLFATFKAKRAIEDYLLERNPEVGTLPDSRRKRALDRLHKEFQNDPGYTSLVEAERRSQALLESAYPQLFVTDEQINADRARRREEVKADPAFQAANAQRAAAYQAQEEYLISHDERVIDLRAELDAGADGKE
ncbi:sulfatase [Alienimonas chondri]|uniref:Sulfatase N-terminal domain-containing protein n=1 Tax=Alienimonas chondri TaxID=2681879 RepID=A0ABX1VC01_9PLAN|nr:sulfatase [Alienimonas chondri]NNJ25263.1 hypothetical protein [Alienimonas chondri]